MQSPTCETIDFSDDLAPQARFRVYGVVNPVIPSNVCDGFDLAHVFSGGRVVLTSDQHFGVGSNLILPGRGTAITAPYISLWALLFIPSLKHTGKDMGDGWETKRSRQPGHKDWAIIKL